MRFAKYQDTKLVEFNDSLCLNANCQYITRNKVKFMNNNYAVPFVNPCEY
jgi:hypothetical protein